MVLIFTRSSDDAATETASENNISENETVNGNGENGRQPTSNPVPNPTPAPEPQLGILPTNWDSLTVQEKTELNSFGCDHEAQWVSAENGSCINKASEQETNMATEYILLTENRDCDEPTGLPWGDGSTLCN